MQERRHLKMPSTSPGVVLQPGPMGGLKGKDHTGDMYKQNIYIETCYRGIKLGKYHHEILLVYECILVTPTISS